MKVEVTSNGEVRIFLSPENAIDEYALDALSKTPVEIIYLNKQVQILDKQFAKGAIIQLKKGRENTSDPISPVVSSTTLNEETPTEEK